MWKVLPTIVKQDTAKATEYKANAEASNKFSILKLSSKKEGSEESTVKVTKGSDPSPTAATTTTKSANSNVNNTPGSGIDAVTTSSTAVTKTEETTTVSSIHKDSHAHVNSIEVTTVTTTIQTTTVTTKTEIIPPCHVPIRLPVPSAADIGSDEWEKLKVSLPVLPMNLLKSTVSPNESRSHKASHNLFHFLTSATSTEPVEAYNFNASNPYPSALVSSKVLTGPKALKAVYEITLDVSHLNWAALKAGDVIGILAPNPDSVVLPLLHRLGYGDGTHITHIENKNLEGQGPQSPVLMSMKTGKLFTSYEAFRFLFDLSAPPRKPLLRVLLEYATSEEDQKSLAKLLADAAAFKVLKSWNPTLADLLETFPSIKSIPFEVLFENLSRLQPRWYSICGINKAQKTISVAFHMVEYVHEVSGRPAVGHATSWLQEMIEESKSTSVSIKLPIFPKIVAGAGFYLPDVAKVAETQEGKSQLPPLIFISAGTGLTPFISFLQELEEQQASNKEILNDVWVLHGRRFLDTDAGDRIYGSELDSWVSTKLVTDYIQCVSRWHATAESSDDLNVYKSLSSVQSITELAINNSNGVDGVTKEPRKILKGYVQDGIKEHKQRLWDLIHSQKAMIYVCGSIAMSKAVHTALIEVALELGGATGALGGQGDLAAAKKYVAALSTEGRYLKDVWG
jgi:sulfite reductase alpha subunit-like flavoprotein